MTTWTPSDRPHTTSHILSIWITLFFTLFSWAGGLPILHACGEEPTPLEGTIGLSDVKQGMLLFRSGQAGRFIPAPSLKTDVQITVTGVIARAIVTQEFTNPGKDWAEGIYVFPLPETAAVDHLRMKVGERTIEGQIKERGEAKKVYEQAKQEGKRASLVEQERPNIFTTSIANIAPRDSITIQIEYQETVRFDQGTFSLRFPLVVGPRYIPGTPILVEDQPQAGQGMALDTDRVPDASRVTPLVEHPAYGSINPVSLSVDLAPGFPLGRLESASHPILIIPESDGRRHVTLRQDTVPADRDFQLTWQPAPGQNPTAALFTQQQQGETYAFMMMMPPATVGKAPVGLPRETIFIIDTSGSMSGTSIEQARAALLMALPRLTARDTFNVIEFNSIVHALFPSPQPVTTATMRKAMKFVDRLVANGGTEMLPALTQALKAPADLQRIQQVIFLTDGQVGNETELFELIRQRLGPRRLFTIGIGSAPNSHFMRKASEFGRGTFTHIGNVNEVKDKMDALFRKLEHPVLTEIRLEGTGLDGAELFPSRIPDLYDGEPVVVAIKTRSLPDEVTIQGKEGSTPWKVTLSLTQSPSREGLSVYWARQKIAALMDHERSGQDDATLRQAVLDVALPHHLVSQYSSLVAVDVTPVRPIDKSLIGHAMKTNLPDGQDSQAMLGLPKTGTSGQIQLLFGLLLLAIAGLLWQRQKVVA
ncbi:MAG: marine proteobacterial sortase target protein [Nitrospirota bacterium]|nr:marine proteobacterial sortase target protein [Nitrospirota bacterium]